MNSSRTSILFAVWLINDRWKSSTSTSGAGVNSDWQLTGPIALFRWLVVAERKWRRAEGVRKKGDEGTFFSPLRRVGGERRSPEVFAEFVPKRVARSARLFLTEVSRQASTGVSVEEEPLWLLFTIVCSCSSDHSRNISAPFRNQLTPRSVLCTHWFQL